MPEYKPGKIVIEKSRRNSPANPGGVYAEQLPLSSGLARRFNVNFKTINKVFHQLAADGILFGKKGCGTFLRIPANLDSARLAKVFFEGYATVSTHPFRGRRCSAAATG